MHSTYKGSLNEVTIQLECNASRQHYRLFNKKPNARSGLAHFELLGSGVPYILPNITGYYHCYSSELDGMTLLLKTAIL